MPPHPQSLILTGASFRDAGRRRCDQPVFCTQTMHQPPVGTLLPANILQPAVASAALPWYWAQLPHFWVGLYVGFDAATTLVASVTKCSAAAEGSFGSSGGSAAASASRDTRPMVGNRAPAMRPPLTTERREILDCMCVPRWLGRLRHFSPFRISLLVNIHLNLRS